MVLFKSPQATCNRRFLLLVHLLLFSAFHTASSRLGKEGIIRKRASSPKLAAVNLGGWLVIEKWIRPSIWDGIPEPAFLDGSQVQFKAVTLNKYMSAEGGGGQQLVVNRQLASGWETFKVWRYQDSVVSLRVFNTKFVSAVNGGGGAVEANAEFPGEWERFTLSKNSTNNRVHIKAHNGMYLQAKDENTLTADYVSLAEPDWGENPFTFEMNINLASPLHGEYQLANGWGPENAARVFKNHRESFFTAADFEYLSKIGINGVRIPVGYWIASDPDPPKPFVPGSLQALDNAFMWAENFNLKIILDLHAAPGSQNGQEHSASIDGVSQWATGTDESGKSYIDLTLDVIDFLTSRYCNRSVLFGIELLNEPMVNDVPLDILKGYYKKGYNIVRKYSANTHVIICQMVGGDPADLLELGTEFLNAILDLHYYNVFGDTFANMSVQENIDYINNQRHQEMERLANNSNGLLTFVGEWSNEWAIRGASQTDYERFGEVQLEVYGQATAGWAYWNYVIDQPNFNNWSFKQSYEKGYILRPSNGWIS